jgi:uncharacterized membrane protein YdjX (TVP38/TMEM64 family)
MVRVTPTQFLAGSLLFGLIIILLGAPTLFREPMQRWLGAFESFAAERPVLAVGTFVGLAALSIILGPFSSAPTVPFAVTAWGESLTFLLLLGGWIFGAVIAYAIGWGIKESLVELFVGREKLAKWLDRIARRLDFLTLLLFRLAMPSETGYVFGILRYRFRSYLLITLLAEIPFALFLVYGSSAIVNLSGWSLALIALAWVTVIGIALRLFLRRTKSPEAADTTEDPRTLASL